MKLKVLNNGILFKFCDDTTAVGFVNTSKSGLVIIPKGFGDQTGIPRWGEVLTVGPDVSDVKVGMYICIEHGMWTPYVKFENEKYWKTDETKILLVDDKPHLYEM